MTVAGAFLIYGVAGLAYLSLLGAAVMPWIVHRRWLPYRTILAPYYGWATLVAIGYPLNAAIPGRWVILGLGALALAVCGVRRTRRRHTRGRWRVRPATLVPAALGAATYAAAAALHVRAGSLSALVADSDVEHFADAIAAIVSFPIGWSAEAHAGLEATPVGLAYHYVHAVLSVVTGADTFATAVPSHFLMLALAPIAVFVFARDTLGLPLFPALVACGLYSLGGLALGVASFGWGQQTAALATVPVALAALRPAIATGGFRALATAALIGTLGACSLYLATAPLVGGVAIMWAGLETGRALRRRAAAGEGRYAAARPIVRLLAIGAGALAAAAFSHLSAATFLAGRAEAGLLTAEDLSGRSTHVTTSASLGAVLGVTPLDLFGNVTWADGATALHWTPPGGEWPAAMAIAALCGLAAAGAATSASRRPYVIAVLAVIAAFLVYLRWVRPFPYGEFKLLSSVWFLVPCFITAGAHRLMRAAPRHGRWASPALALAARTTATLVLALYAAGLWGAHAHVRALLALPWGAALPETEVDAARQIVRAVPAGAPVWVSNLLVPARAVGWPGSPAAHRAGFPSQAAGQAYLGKRWRGVVTGLLAFSGRVPYGTVERHSTELRLPAGPSLAEYVLLDESEDPRLFGLLEDDLVASATRLRLYRQPSRVAALWRASEAAGTSSAAIELHLTADRISTGAQPSRPVADRITATGTLPPPVLPIGESFPGRRTGYAAPVRPPDDSPPASGRGHAVVGLIATEPVPLRIEIDDGLVRRSLDVLAGPGLTWYTSPELVWPGVVRLSTSDGSPLAMRVPAIAAVTVDRSTIAAPLEESLARSRAGVDAPLVVAWLSEAPDSGGVDLTTFVADVTAAGRAALVRLRAAPVLWLGGDATPLPVSTADGVRGSHVRLDPFGAAAPDGVPAGEPTRLRAPRWTTETGAAWLWLEVGRDAEPSLHTAPLAAVHASATALRIATTRDRLAVAAALPLASTATRPAVVEDGTLIKGASDHLFYVENGQLRWVSSLDVLQRRAISVRFVVLRESELWGLPAGLPLT